MEVLYRICAGPGCAHGTVVACARHMATGSSSEMRTFKTTNKDLLACLLARRARRTHVAKWRRTGLWKPV